MMTLWNFGYNTKNTRYGGDFMERYDIAIIGSGPAGISAAITAKLRNKHILFLGNKNLSNKIEKATTIYNYPGLPQISGEDLQTAYRKHLEEMDISITEDRINTVYPMGSYFALIGTEGNYEATTVILASGVIAAKHFPGEQSNLGKGISYCATCDAPLYNGKEAIIVSYSKKEEAEAAFLAERAKQVYYFPQYSCKETFAENVKIIQDVPVSVEKTETKMQLICKSGNYNADGIFILRDSIPPTQLLPALKLDKQHVAVTRQMETNIPGLFACGDVTGTPYQYVKAAGEGNVAALSAVAYLTH